MRRRTAIRYLLGLAGALPFAPLRGWARRAAFPGAQPDTLGELAAVVLPSSLGRAKTDEVADRFVRWVREYKPGADMAHGYGFGLLKTKPPSPAETYTRQLEALERAALDRGGPFTRLESDAKRALVEASLAEAKVEELPRSPDGRHVVADLMSFYFRSDEADNLCYSALIGKHECLGLPGSDRAPKPMPGPSLAAGAPKPEEH